MKRMFLMSIIMGILFLGCNNEKENNYSDGDMDNSDTETSMEEDFDLLVDGDDDSNDIDTIDAEEFIEEDIESSGDGDVDTIDSESEITGKGTWYDSNYGLTWQLHSHGGPRSEDCEDYESSLEYCEELTLGGYTDWRMPSISELRSLVRGCSQTILGGFCTIEDNACTSDSCKDSCISCDNNVGPDNGCYWPDGMEGDCGVHWSSTFVDETYESFVWTVNFEDGGVNSNGNTKYSRWSVRCVRGDLFNNYEIPTDGDEDEHAGTWHDPVYTKYTWQSPEADIPMKWYAAIQYCDDLVLGGYNDWYLPSIFELRTLVDECSATNPNGSCNTLSSTYDETCEGCEEIEGKCYMTVPYSACTHYWSSTKYPDSNTLVWSLYFPQASLNAFNIDTYVRYVMCVRKE